MTAPSRSEQQIADCREDGYLIIRNVRMLFEARARRAIRAEISLHECASEGTAKIGKVGRTAHQQVGFEGISPILVIHSF